MKIEQVIEGIFDEMWILQKINNDEYDAVRTLCHESKGILDGAELYKKKEMENK